MFFQRRGSELHGFSTALSPPFDHAGYSVVMLLDFVTYASRVPRPSPGRASDAVTNNVTQRFLQPPAGARARCSAGRSHLDGWIHFGGPPA